MLWESVKPVDWESVLTGFPYRTPQHQSAPPLKEQNSERFKDIG